MKKKLFKFRCEICGKTFEREREETKLKEKDGDYSAVSKCPKCGYTCEIKL